MPSLPQPRSDNWPRSKIHPGQQHRTPIGAERLRDLHQSMLAQGVLQPVGVIDRIDDNLIWGFQRYEASGLGGIETLPVLVFPVSIPPVQVKLARLTENIHHNNPEDRDIFRSCVDLLEASPDWSRTELAEFLGKSPSTVTRWLSPLGLIPAGREAFLDGKFKFSKAYQISLANDQVKALEDTLKGAKRDDLAQARKRAKQNGEQEPVPRIRIPMSTDDAKGIVTLSGLGDEAITYDDAEALLKEALKFLRAVKDKGTSPATAMKVWKETIAKEVG